MSKSNKNSNKKKIEVHKVEKENNGVNKQLKDHEKMTNDEAKTQGGFISSVITKVKEKPLDSIGFILPLIVVSVSFLLMLLNFINFCTKGGYSSENDKIIQMGLIDALLPKGWIALYGKYFLAFIGVVVLIECVLMILDVFVRENVTRKTFFGLAILGGIFYALVILGLLGKLGFGAGIAKLFGIVSFRKFLVFGGFIFVVYSTIVLFFCEGFKYYYYVMMIPSYCLIVLPFATVLMKSTPKGFSYVYVLVIFIMFALMLVLLAMGYYRQKASLPIISAKTKQKSRESKLNKDKKETDNKIKRNLTSVAKKIKEGKSSGPDVKKIADVSRKKLEKAGNNIAKTGRLVAEKITKTVGRKK